jgi:prepilin-type N-terminal cleavage/methylation domain-containing protein
MTRVSRRPDRRLRSRRGFTLIELMISLVMSLIIALAAVSLSKATTSTFFEQARASGVQANIRTASERLRNDLARAAFMSTPNVHSDPKVARIPGSSGDPYRIVTLKDLQGIRISPAANAVRTHPLTTGNNLSPHELHVAGNLTSDDLYRGVLVAEGNGCSTDIRLSGLADASVRRLFGGATSPAQRKTMTELVFTPGSRMNPPVLGVDYAVQVMDMRGCFHYLTVCSILESTDPAESVVIRLRGGLLTTEQTNGDVCGVRLMEEVAIAPVQRVRWGLSAETDARRVGATSATAGDVFSLNRQLMAADGVTEVGPPEVVSEYAVDLRFGLMVDEAVGTEPRLKSIDFESPDADFAAWAGPASASLPNIGPQRLRSVRYRLAFRTSLADRDTPLVTPSGAPYMYRYKVGENRYARVRTLISEAVLMNQTRATY